MKKQIIIVLAIAVVLPMHASAKGNGHDAH